MLSTACLALAMGMVEYRGIISSNLDLSETFLKFDFRGFFSLSPATLSAVIFVLFLLDLFDSLGTVVAVGQQAQLARGGQLPKAGKALFSSAAGTAMGACLGTSTVVCYVESAADATARVCPLSTLRAVKLTSGMTAPLLSLTTPKMVAVGNCAMATETLSRKRNNPVTLCFFHQKSPLRG